MPGTGLQRGAGRQRRLGAVRPEQRGEQPAVVLPVRVGRRRRLGERRRGRACARPRWNSFMYGNLSSRVPYTIVGTRYGSTVSARSQPSRSSNWNAFWA